MNIVQHFCTAAQSDRLIWQLSHLYLPYHKLLSFTFIDLLSTPPKPSKQLQRLSKSIAHGVRQYQTLKSIAHGVRQYRTLKPIAHGVRQYQTLKPIAHGVRQYRTLRSSLEEGLGTIL